MGGYVKRCLGLRFTFKVGNPAGLRIQELFIAGRQAEPEREYPVTFVTEQGVPQKYGRVRTRLEFRAVDALERYLARHSPAHSELRGTVVAV
jgi:S-sulfosulfanyl-L-cysteine sulfohydrolase